MGWIGTTYGPDIEDNTRALSHGAPYTLAVPVPDVTAERPEARRRRDAGEQEEVRATLRDRGS